MQFLLQPDNSAGNDQVFRVQITDAPEVFNIVTEPKPVSLPLSFNNSELTLPMCGPGVDFETTDQKMTWKTTNIGPVFDLVDSAGGVTLYQAVSITGVVWYNGAATPVSGGFGVVEVYHP
jgi:hypothetical protein